MCRRGETVERSFAHVYDTGGCAARICGHTNILKRILIHVSGFNLGRILRQMIGVGTPRGLQDPLRRRHRHALGVLMSAAQRRLAAIWAPHRRITAARGQLTSPTTIVNSSMMASCTTGC
jgi:hypothetical protein